MALSLSVVQRPEPNHWVALQGLTMRLRALVDAARASGSVGVRASRPLRVEAALRSLEADIQSHTERLAEEMLSAWAARRPRPPEPEPPSPIGDIPDLVGLA